MRLPSLDEIRAGIAACAHMDRADGYADGVAAIQAVVDDGGSAVHVAAVLASNVVARMRAVGLDVGEWAALALPAAADWDSWSPAVAADPTAEPSNVIAFRSVEHGAGTGWLSRGEWAALDGTDDQDRVQELAETLAGRFSAALGALHGLRDIAGAIRDQQRAEDAAVRAEATFAVAAVKFDGLDVGGTVDEDAVGELLGLAADVRGDLLDLLGLAAGVVRVRDDGDVDDEGDSA